MDYTLNYPLKRQAEVSSLEIILSNPDFYKAITEVKERLRTDTAAWHTFEEVFYQKQKAARNVIHSD